MNNGPANESLFHAVFTVARAALGPGGLEDADRIPILAVVHEEGADGSIYDTVARRLSRCAYVGATPPILFIEAGSLYPNGTIEEAASRIVVLRERVQNARTTSDLTYDGGDLISLRSHRPLVTAYEEDEEDLRLQLAENIDDTVSVLARAGFMVVEVRRLTGGHTVCLRSPDNIGPVAAADYTAAADVVIGWAHAVMAAYIDLELQAGHHDFTQEDPDPCTRWTLQCLDGPRIREAVTAYWRTELEFADAAIEREGFVWLVGNESTTRTFAWLLGVTLTPPLIVTSWTGNVKDNAEVGIGMATAIIITHFDAQIIGASRDGRNGHRAPNPRRLKGVIVTSHEDVATTRITETVTSVRTRMGVQKQLDDSETRFYRVHVPDLNIILSDLLRASIGTIPEDLKKCLSLPDPTRLVSP